MHEAVCPSLEGCSIVSQIQAWVPLPVGSLPGLHASHLLLYAQPSSVTLWSWEVIKGGWAPHQL